MASVEVPGGTEAAIPTLGGTNTSHSGTPSTSSTLLSMPMVNIHHAAVQSLVRESLLELLEQGDVQHLVTVCEILLRIGHKVDSVSSSSTTISGLEQFLHSIITPLRLRESYLSYLDILHKLQLYCEATVILKYSSDAYMKPLSRLGVQLYSACGKCGKEIAEGTSLTWCTRCARSPVVCSLCQKTCGGLYHWCPICSHGGHYKCMKLWFREHGECPAGCGHHCCLPGLGADL